MGKNKGEKNAELPTLEEAAKKGMADEQIDAIAKRTLKIWDVPAELANKFISTARGSYANKSWLYLQDIMRKANLYDEMVSSGRLDEHERRLIALEEFAERMVAAMETAKEEEVKKKPKTLGGE
jgi:hypothetical protein